MLWTQSHSDACTHIPSPACFVAVRPTLERTCRKSWKKKLLHYFSRCTRGYSPGLNATLEIRAFPHKLGDSHCRFEKLWGKKSLNATVNGGSHYNRSPEPLIWGLFEHSPSESYLSLSLFLFCRYLCLSHSVSPSRSEPNCTQSECFVQPLVVLHLLHRCTVQRAELKHYSIKWIISEHLRPSMGLSLAMNQEEFSWNDDRAETLWKLAAMEW